MQFVLHSNLHFIGINDLYVCLKTPKGLRTFLLPKLYLGL